MLKISNTFFKVSANRGGNFDLKLKEPRPTRKYLFLAVFSVYYSDDFNVSFLDRPFIKVTVTAPTLSE